MTVNNPATFIGSVSPAMLPGDGLYPPSNPWQRDADYWQVPLIPQLPPQRQIGDPNPIMAICGECGRKVHRLEGYYCGNGRCPVQPQVTCHG